MAPVVEALRQISSTTSIVCVTGQHREMLDQVLQLFGIKVDYDLGLMTRDQTLNGLAGRAFPAIDAMLDQVRPDRVLVHGDTTTAMVAALAAFHRRIPVGHVEAGLRTYDLAQPWPEEMNRRVVDLASDLLFAPTAGSKANLQGERLAGRIVVTGNTVIDALETTVARIDGDAALRGRLDQQFAHLSDRSPPAAGDGPPAGEFRRRFREHLPRAGDAQPPVGHRDRLSGAPQSQRPRAGPREPCRPAPTSI